MVFQSMPYGSVPLESLGQLSRGISMCVPKAWWESFKMYTCIFVRFEEDCTHIHVHAIG